MRIRAAGSACVICFTASMPPISGMMMSIVTRSGFSCWYFSTACFPFSASPTTVNPACDRMSLTIVRMKTASSQTSTVLLTLPPLSDYVLNHCLDIENQHSPSVDLHDSCCRTHYWNVALTTGTKLIDRHILNVPHIIHANADPAFRKIHQQDEAFGAPECRSSQRRSAVYHRDDGTTQIDQATNRVRSSRQPRHLARRNDFPEGVHVAGVGIPAELENQQATRRNVWLFLRDFLGRGREGDSVTHKNGRRRGGRCLRRERAPRQLRRARDANPRAGVSESRAA